MRGATYPGLLSGAGTPFDWPTALGYSRQPFTNLLAGRGGLTAGPNGVALGIFGWADPNTGQVSNVQGSGQQLGFVLPIFEMWNWQGVYRQCGAPGTPPLLIRRPGLEVVLASQGDFLTRFPLGAQAGQQVFTDPATGLPYSGNPGGYVPTGWTVMQSGGCNERCRISSFTRPFN